MKESLEWNVNLGLMSMTDGISNQMIIMTRMCKVKNVYFLIYDTNDQYAVFKIKAE